MLYPSPPNESFAIPIATRLPINNIQIGKPAGTFSARSRPVSAAEPSLMVVGTFIMYFCIMYSNTTQDPIAIKVIRKADMPNTKKESKVTGISAMIT
jgi:hypothetical protein